MSDVKVSFSLPDDEAMALAQLCKRTHFAHVKDVSISDDNYKEGYEMLRALDKLRTALNKAGYAPR